MKTHIALLDVSLAPFVKHCAVVDLGRRLRLQLPELIGEDFDFGFLVFFLAVQLVRDKLSPLFNRHLVGLGHLFRDSLRRDTLATSCSLFLLLAGDQTLLQFVDPLTVLRLLAFVVRSRRLCLRGGDLLRLHTGHVCLSL